MAMTLPTTRIDTTLSPPGGHTHSMSNGVGVGVSPSPSGTGTTGSEDSTQQILLLDLTPHAHQVADGSSESLGSGGGLPSLPISYQVPTVPGQIPGQGQGQGQLHMHRNFNNDLSNFTLVNLTNANDEEDEESDINGEGRPMIPSKPQLIQQQPQSNLFLPRTSFGGGGALPGRRGSSGGGGVNHGVSNHGRRMSSSLSSSSEDSDTGFLVPGRSHNGVGSLRGGRKDPASCQYRLQKQNLGPILPSLGSPPGFNGEGANSHVFQQQTGNTRKRLKRKRSTGRRKSMGSRPLGRENMEASDLFPICCCFADDPQEDRQRYSGSSSSLTSRYLRLSCVIVLIIFIATFTSIMVSLQRKVDSISLEVNKISSPTSVGTVPTAPDNVNRTGNGSTSQIDEISSNIDRVNASLVTFTNKLTELSEKVGNLEKQPSIDELRKDLAQLGSEMKGSIEELQKNVEALKRKAAEADKEKDNVNNRSGGVVISKVPGQGQSNGANPGDNNVPNNVGQKLQQTQPASP